MNPDQINLIVVGNFLSFILLSSLLLHRRNVEDDRRAARKRRIMRAWDKNPRKRE